MDSLLVLATRNAHKIQEIKHSVGSRFHYLTLDDFNELGELPEPFATFSENALSKARYVFEATGEACLADDSGLVCDDLNGAPGVYSARYAGPDATDAQNRDTLIQTLGAKQNPTLRAYFVCVLAYFTIDGQSHTFTGQCHGHLTLAPRGAQGFGYDPLFIPQGHSVTMAELPLATKNQLSHRAKALKAWLDFLNQTKA